MWWWAAAAAAPALDSNVNSKTTERPKEDMRKTTEDKRNMGKENNINTPRRQKKAKL